MSGVEVIAVVACVAAIVSAYNDGSRMYTAIKNKYHQRQSTRELERSLKLGRTEIQYRFDQHHQELGQRWELGDAIAREQMKDIIITLQGALLRHLREAQERGTTLDLNALQIESDQGRVRTITILGELYQRLSRPSHVPPSFSMFIDPNYHRMNPQGYSSHSPDGYLPSHPSEMRYLSGGYPVSPASYTTGRVQTQDTLGPSREYPVTDSRPSRRSSSFGLVMGDLFRSRPVRGSASSAPESRYIPSRGYGAASPSTSDPIPEFDARPAPPLRPILQINSIPDDHDVVSGNPWKDSYDDSDDDTFSHARMKEEENSHLSPISPSTQTRHGSLSAASTASTDSTPSNPSTHSSTDATRPLWPPSKLNKYLGFCKGAWKVHSGFRGFRIYTEPGTGFYTQQSWLRCAHCAFEAPMAHKSSNRNPQFEESVRTHKASGVRYRYGFLAKSHVYCKRDAGSHFAPNTPRGAFCCVFCCAMAHGSTQVYGNLDTFMAHLVEQHWTVERGTLAVLPSVQCVVGRVASDSEKFDVNILPARG
ncbi:hypothetical protein N7517_002144 [Penicillium concentricum]|uniref:Prion-inhibition and propagation HeLo domain-containing protein n=1 Tax=Penicillium concentricum TaxID=293559 RepID=A0A9W9VJ85_9EURO|nr:uncharacterized protein N7517_002144 [Penicillium concentricum]KAJ5384233.1 hypothetical protein N7517_002144 [Penicillium concentricum]